MKTKHNSGLKIAVLVKRFITSGGSERYAVEIARRLRDKGHRVDLFSREFEAQQCEGMGLYRVPDRFGFSSVLNLFSFAWHTARMLAGKRYDVIHSHERGYGQDVSTIHTFSYKGGTRKYSALRRIDQVYLSPRSRLHLWLEQKQMETPWLVAVSGIVKEDTGSNYTGTQPIAVIHPGVDTDWFHHQWIAQRREAMRRKEGIAAEEMAVLFVGSEFKRKGLDRLIPAIGPGMRLLVVGQGEREAHYRRLIAKHHLTGRVELKGLSDDIRRYLAGADVVVLPSIIEAFGMSILEGMACGLPVVASSNAGVSALIEDGVNGFSIQDPARLAGVLRHLQDPAERQRIGRQGRRTAERHTWDTAAQKYENLYYEIAVQKEQGQQNAYT